MQAAIINGYVKISAETPQEAAALQDLYPNSSEFCQCCGQMDHKIMFDITVLTSNPTQATGSY